MRRNRAEREKGKVRGLTVFWDLSGTSADWVRRKRESGGWGECGIKNTYTQVRLQEMTTERKTHG